MVECKLSSSWKVSQGSLDDTVKVGMGCDESQTSVAPLILEPTPDSRSCEITVEFHGTLAVESISIASSSRQCEVYFLRGEETEYICTRRGELEEERSESCYKLELDFEGAGSCVGVKVKLLSLVKSNEAHVRRIAISGTPEATAMPVQERGTSSGLDAGMLRTMMPSMLQMLRGMSNGVNRSRKEEVSTSRDENTAKTSSPTTEDKTVQQVAKGFQDEMSYRLQRLEMVVTNMNSFVQLAFGKMDQRLDCLEKQISALQPCVEAESALPTATNILHSEVSPAQATDETLEKGIEKGQEDPQNEEKLQIRNEQVGMRETLEAMAEEELSGREQSEDSEDEQAHGSEETQTRNDEVFRQESDSSVLEAVVLPQRSISFEDAWSSSLEAFSNSARLDLVQEEKVGLENDVQEQVGLKNDVQEKVGLENDVQEKVGLENDVHEQVGLKNDVQEKVGLENDVQEKVGLENDVQEIVGLENDADVLIEVCPEVCNVNNGLEATDADRVETGDTLNGSYELCESPDTIETETATDLIDWSDDVRATKFCTSTDTAESQQVSFIDSICEAPSASETIPEVNEPVQVQASLESTELISF